MNHSKYLICRSSGIQPLWKGCSTHSLRTPALGQAGQTRERVWPWCLQLLRRRVSYQWGLKKTGWPQLPVGRRSVSEEGSVGSNYDEKLCKGRQGPAGLSAQQSLSPLTKASGGRWQEAQLEWIEERVKDKREKPVRSTIEKSSEQLKMNWALEVVAESKKA